MHVATVIKAAGFAALFAASAAYAAPVNLISNGDFENNAVSAPDGGYLTVSIATPDAITGWTVGGQSVDLIKNNYGAISGTSIDMLGTPGPGVLSQSFTAAANTEYVLSFDLGRNPGAPLPNGAQVAVNFGSTTQNFIASVNGSHSTYTMDYFSGANAGATLLQFASVGGDNYSGAVLDNVSVTAAVPEPETYAMLLAGLGLLGFIARRKKSA